MTGWWWCTASPKLPDDGLAAGLAGHARAMTPHMGKLVEFNTSCASVFTQRAGLAALSARMR
jgi:hypothetical protein